MPWAIRPGIMLRMSDTTKRGQDPATRVADYILRMIPPGRSVHEWCDERGIDDRRVSKWKTTGGDLGFKSMRDVAKGLGLTIGQVLVIAGYMKQRDLDGSAPPPKPAPPPPPTIAEAIEGDPTLTPEVREALRGVVALNANRQAGGRGGTRRGRTRS